MKRDNIFLEVPKYYLTKNERQELMSYQSQATYTEFEIPAEFELEGLNDGNLVSINPHVPDWVFDKFKLPLELSISYLFLKNTGLNIKHTEGHRQSSLTVLLSNNETGTDFYNEKDELLTTLVHNGNTFLQNNKVRHYVEPTKVWRYFFQISFDLPFNIIVEHLK